MNEKDVRLTYRFLAHKEESEVRLMNPFEARDVKSIFVYSEDQFVDICRKFQNRYNIYIGINERKKGGRTSADVKSINAIVYDIDSIHPVGMPSNTMELRKARLVAQNLFDFLKKENKNPFMAMSGNGWQIWTRVGVSLDGFDNGKVAAVLKDMFQGAINSFSGEGAKIDNIGDLARVIKVIGTKAIKATTTPDRANRVSYWEISPEDVPSNVGWGNTILELSKTRESEKLRPVNAPEIEMSSLRRLRYLVKFDKRMLDLFDGRWQIWHYKSRSEAEYALICAMIDRDIPGDDIWLLMEESKIGKWPASKDQYKSLTMSRAYAAKNKSNQ